MTRNHLQKTGGNATLAVLLIATGLLNGCGSTPPAPTPRQLQEYARHTSVGLEKHRDGHLGEARNAFLRALARAEMDDDGQLIATALLNLGASELALDNLDAASAAFGRASREARLVSQTDLDWQAISGLAEATRRSGHAAKALALFAARPAPGKSLPLEAQWMADIARARAMADEGQTDPALALIDTLILAGKNRPQPDRVLATALHAKASVLLSTGKHSEADTTARQALDLDRALHHPPSVAEDHRLLGQIAAAQNNKPVAQQHYLRAAGIFANTGQDKRAESCKTALEKLTGPH